MHDDETRPDNERRPFQEGGILAEFAEAKAEFTERLEELPEPEPEHDTQGDQTQSGGGEGGAQEGGVMGFFRALSIRCLDYLGFEHAEASTTPEDEESPRQARPEEEPEEPTPLRLELSGEPKPFRALDMDELAPPQPEADPTQTAREEQEAQDRQAREEAERQARLEQFDRMRQELEERQKQRQAQSQHPTMRQ